VKIKQLKDKRWEYDSGEIDGQRVRRIFDTFAAAEAFLGKAEDLAKKEGQRLLIDWLSDVRP
jgi:hypothetical protein